MQCFYIKKALIRDSGLRGFRPDTGGSGPEKFIRNIVAKAAGLTGTGDVLMAIAGKAE